MRTAPKSTPGRRTRQRIRDVTLGLYNALGEPNVSTSLIATELGISAGNLHYHFRKKDQLSAALLEQFVAELDALLPPAGWRADNVEDVWLRTPGPPLRAAGSRRACARPPAACAR